MILTISIAHTTLLRYIALNKESAIGLNIAPTIMLLHNSGREGLVHKHKTKKHVQCIRASHINAYKIVIRTKFMSRIRRARAIWSGNHWTAAAAKAFKLINSLIQLPWSLFIIQLIYIIVIIEREESRNHEILHNDEWANTAQFSIIKLELQDDVCVCVYVCEGGQLISKFNDAFQSFVCISLWIFCEHTQNTPKIISIFGINLCGWGLTLLSELSIKISTQDLVD